MSKRRIFISYPDADRQLARRVERICANLGYETFIAADQAALLADPSGWFDSLIRQIDVADQFILCLNTSSLSAKFQQFEWRYVAPRLELPKLIVHEGAWNKSYEDVFPAISVLQHFPDTKKGVEALKQILEPSTPPEEQRFAFMQRLVIDAGTQLMMRFGAQSIYGTPQTLRAQKNPTIDVDVLIQKQIVTQIRTAFPDDGIIAEEDDMITDDSLAKQRFVWTVDPLDGTLNFMSAKQSAVLDGPVASAKPKHCRTRLTLQSGQCCDADR